MTVVPVNLGERGYEIHIGSGLLNRVGELISSVCAGRSAAIITNPAIGGLYAGRLAAGLERSGITPHIIYVPAGERFKSLRTVARVYERLLDERMDRGGIVIGLGGGVVGDLAGFTAATYLRGLDFVQIPTSLLAQVDASVGGKTGVNLSRGKNLVGAFYQPKLVLTDVSTLETLSPREFRAGLAEVIKHGIIRDAAYFARLESVLGTGKRLDESELEWVIARSCEIKAEVVLQDERESGLRRVLNYGHTVAHAVESLTRFRRYKHGEAVAIGMVTAALVARELGRAAPDLVDRVSGILRAGRLSSKPPSDVAPAEIVSAMGLDKKVAHGKLHVVLVDDIGSSYVADDVPPEAWRTALEMQALL